MRSLQRAPALTSSGAYVGHWTGAIVAVKNAASDTGRISTEIVRAATDLDVQASSLRAQVDAFMARVRAA